jgi:hypothetical protein
MRRRPPLTPGAPTPRPARTGSRAHSGQSYMLLLKIKPCKCQYRLFLIARLRIAHYNSTKRIGERDLICCGGWGKWISNVIHLLIHVTWNISSRRATGWQVMVFTSSLVSSPDRAARCGAPERPEECKLTNLGAQPRWTELHTDPSNLSWCL